MDEIAEGRAAWQRLQSQHRTAWSDWRAIGKALKIGRDATLAAAGAKTPHGKIYTRLFAAWLVDNGLDAIPQQARFRALRCIEHLAEIEAWRAGLDEPIRNKLNHPDSIWWNFQRDMLGVQRTQTRPYRPANTGATFKGSKFGYHKTIQFDQAVVKRVGDAIRENWSNDCYRLAIVALRAAIRNEDDLLALLPPEPVAKPAPRLIAAPPVALELEPA